ncbi:hypothetical protein [Enhygromyxa salina]|uniref:hypothetical protein n=1 Tax=Enhygromyxa salina TaxID=215803 RepID=UPI0011B1E712|nr:hypothetical protein [Enhygromyxa salina]
MISTSSPPLGYAAVCVLGVAACARTTTTDEPEDLAGMAEIPAELYGGGCEGGPHVSDQNLPRHEVTLKQSMFRGDGWVRS